MAQYISITGSAFGNGHDSSTTYSVTLPTGASGSVSLFGGGAVNAITKAELTAGIQLTIDDNTITSIGVLVNSGFACAGLTESGSWLLATATPTPLPATATPLPATATPEPATATPTPTAEPATATPTPTVETATATPTPTAEPATATPTPTPEPATATPTPTAEPATATPTPTVEPATATPTPTETPIPYNYYTVRGCPGSFYENQDLRIRTTSTLTANGNPSTDSVIYHNGSSFYGYATIDESTWLVDADLPSITYSGAIDVGCPSSATATPTPTPTATPTPLTAYTVFYDANSELTACAGTPADTIYSNCNPVIQGGSCTLYTDAGGTTPVAGGYYYDGLSGNYFYTEGSNGIVQEVGSCPVPTATPTATPPVCNSTSDVIRSLVDAESTCSGTGNIVYHNGPTGLSDATIIYVNSDCSTVQSNTVWFNDNDTFYQWNGSTLTQISAPNCP